MMFDYVYTAISGAAVNYNIFKVGEGLGNNALDSIVKAFSVIEIDCDD